MRQLISWVFQTVFIGMAMCFGVNGHVLRKALNFEVEAQ